MISMLLILDIIFIKEPGQNDQYATLLDIIFIKDPGQNDHDQYVPTSYILYIKEPGQNDQYAPRTRQHFYKSLSEQLFSYDKLILKKTGVIFKYLFYLFQR